MIVRDEAPVIARCLTSVLPLIDCWVVVDTGSADDTAAIVRASLASLPGALHHRPWVDFASNRTEALALARDQADYTLIIDADDVLEFAPNLSLPRLDADSYFLEIHDCGLVYERKQLVRSALPWRYVGVLHEYLECPGEGPPGRLPGVTMRRNHDGARRRDPSTYRRDVALLETALAEEPDRFLAARYTFYLAQSYRDCGELEKAVALYLRRAELGFWDQEAYCALYQAGLLMERLGQPADPLIDVWSRATALCPGRVEAMHATSRLCRQLGRNQQGYEVARPGLDRTPPGDGLFVEPWIYDHGLLDEFAVNAYWAEHHRESLDACLRLLAKPLSTPTRERVAANAGAAAARLSEARDALFGGLPLWPAGIESPQTELPRPAIAVQRSVAGLVSLITPTYARERFLTSAMRAVRSQDYPECEWLVLDDSPEPSAFMRNQSGEGVTYVHSPDRLTIGEKRNRLVERARGEVIVHFDDDDYYAPEYVSTMVQTLQARRADLINLRGWFLYDLRARFFGYWDLMRCDGLHYRCDPSGVAVCKFGDDEKALLANVELGFGFSYAYRRRLWADAAFPDIDWNEDGEFSLAALRRGAPVDGVHDYEGICLHLLHPASMSRCFPQHHLPRWLLSRLFPGYSQDAS